MALENLRPPSWAIMGALSLSLLCIVCIPPMYETDKGSRDAFLGVMIPVASILYACGFYVVVGREMSGVSEGLRLKKRLDPSGLSKEMRLIRKEISVLRDQNEKMRAVIIRNNVTNEVKDRRDRLKSHPPTKVATPKLGDPVEFHSIPASPCEPIE